jgi:hypothetical protein
MNARDRRAVISGGVVLLPFLLFIWVVRPYLAALGDARDQLATERATLARERAVIATAHQNPRLRQSADSAMRLMQPRLFEGKDDVMASAELAAYLGDVAERSRVWLQDAGTRPAVPAGDGVRNLRVELRAESDLLGTLMFIQGLERGEKLVRIDRIDISRSSRIDDKDAEVLSINAMVSGFAVGDPAATPPNPAGKSSLAAVPSPSVAGAGVNPR